MNSENKYNGINFLRKYNGLLDNTINIDDIDRHYFIAEFINVISIFGYFHGDDLYEKCDSVKNTLMCNFTYDILEHVFAIVLMVIYYECYDKSKIVTFEDIFSTMYSDNKILNYDKSNISFDPVHYVIFILKIKNFNGDKFNSNYNKLYKNSIDVGNILTNKNIV